MLTQERAKINKVLFYAGQLRGFRSTLIGNLYEISQVYPTVLVVEQLDSKTENFLNNKKLFPKLEKIITFNGPKQSIDMVTKNKYIYNLAKNTIHHYKPDIFISPGRYPSHFLLYFRRLAKKKGALNVFVRGWPLGITSEQKALRAELINTYLKPPAFLPLFIRRFLIRCKKNLGHYLFYWILPLSVGEKPFREEPSCILHKSNPGKSVDYYVVSKEDYELSLREGIPPGKLYILGHPLKHPKTREVLKKFYFSNPSKRKSPINTKNLTVMWPARTIGIKKNNLTLISKELFQKNRIEIVELISKTLKGWKVFIKPHPMIKSNSYQFQEMVQIFKNISDSIQVTDPSESADDYVESSDVIVGFSPISTVLYTASLQCPRKPILYLDLQKEFLGDAYKNFEGIKYISDKESLIHILKLIKSNKYCKKNSGEKEKQTDEREFSDTVKMVEYLFNKK